MRTILLVMVLLPCSCGRAERERLAAVEAARAATVVQIERVLSETIQRADRLAGSADRILRPLPVITPAEEDALRRFLSAAHLARARVLGVLRRAERFRRLLRVALGGAVKLNAKRRRIART